MRAHAFAALLAIAGCTRQAAPTATIAGGLLSVGGVIAIAASDSRGGCHHDEACFELSNGQLAGGVLLLVGVPLLVVGGLSWLLADDHPTTAATSPARGGW